MINSTIEWVVSFYDNTKDNFVFSTPLYTDIIEEFTDPSSHILDFGCGYWRVLDDLSQKWYTDLCWIDASKKMIQRAQQYNWDINYAHSTDIHHFKQAYDCIVLNNVLVNICFEGQQNILLKKAWEILKKWWTIIIIDFIISSHQKYIDEYQKNLAKYGENGIYEKKWCLFKHNTPERIAELRSFFPDNSYSEHTVSSLWGTEINQFIIVWKI